MAMDVNPQNGDARQTTSYPFEYENHVEGIVSTDYVVSPDGAVVTCYIKLVNGITIGGVHEQYHDKDTVKFKNLAYQKAIDRAEQLGYRLK